MKRLQSEIEAFFVARTGFEPGKYYVDCQCFAPKNSALGEVGVKQNHFDTF